MHWKPLNSIMLVSAELAVSFHIHMSTAPSQDKKMMQTQRRSQSQPCLFIYTGDTSSEGVVLKETVSSSSSEDDLSLSALVSKGEPYIHTELNTHSESDLPLSMRLRSKWQLRYIMM